MISILRNIINSKLGVGLTLGFLLLIGIAFAASDVTGSGAFGGITGDGNVARIGDAKLTTAEFSQTLNQAFTQLRQQNPEADQAGFVSKGGMERVLSQMIGSYAMAEWAKDQGIGVSKRQIDGEIAGIGAFRGVNGQFDEQVYRRALQQQGISDQRLRGDIGRALLSEQVVVPATFGAGMPAELVAPYAGLILEGREGAIQLVPAAAFAPKTKPSDAELSAYYAKHSDAYRVPERRVIRYATFNAIRFRDQIKVSDAEIAQLYRSRAEQFAPVERRTLEQAIVPTEAAAKAIAAKVSGGQSPEAAARSVGLSTAEIAPVSRTELTKQASSAVADAVFGAAKGTIAQPAKSALGWHVILVKDITKFPGRTLDQARQGLRDEIAENKLRETVAAYTEKLEDSFADGASLSEVAKAEGLELQSTPAILASGRSPDDPSYTATADIQMMLPTAFSLDEDSSPQLAEIVQGREYAVFEVSEIRPSAALPLAKVRPAVEREYRLSKGLAAARKLADSMEKQTKVPGDLGKAIAAAGIKAPPAEPIGVTRQRLLQIGKPVPPPIALMFSMAPGTTKVLEAPNNLGFYVVHLAKINRQDPRKAPGLIDATRGQLARVLADEYTAQLLAAVKADVGVKRNDRVIRQIGDRFAGRNVDN